MHRRVDEVMRKRFPSATAMFLTCTKTVCHYWKNNNKKKKKKKEAKVAAPAIVKTIAAAPAVYSNYAAQPALLKQGYRGYSGYAVPAPVLYKNYGFSGYSSSYSTLERGIAKGYSVPYKQW